jgi:hypothetical protein
VGLQRVALTVVSDAPGYVQLSHPWFPGNVVRVNGQPVAPLEGALDLIVVPIAAGENAIEISPMVTPIRVASNVLSVVSLLLAFAVAGTIGRSRAQSALPTEHGPIPGAERNDSPEVLAALSSWPAQAGHDVEGSVHRSS